MIICLSSIFFRRDTIFLSSSSYTDEPSKRAIITSASSSEDKERSENQAESYANEVLPKARGAAARVIEEANAYKNQVIAKAIQAGWCRYCKV